MVGVGSVGTRCWVALFVGRDEGDPLVLQVKEAEHSVAEPFLSRASTQPWASGWCRASGSSRAPATSSSDGTRSVGIDGVQRDFYFRQMWDWKLSPDVENMSPDAFEIYAQMCGWVLALGHARSGDAMAIGSYLGGGTRFDEAMCTFASAYADQNERDYARLQQAVASGQVAAETGI